MNLYISDTHFGHANIIRYDNRPFSSFEEMDEVLIEKWCNKVKKDDTVYILGDFSWYRDPETITILDELPGNKILIKGNHDRVSREVASRYKKIKDYLEIFDNGVKVVLSHYPIMFWNGQFKDSVHLYGHVHNSHQHNITESWVREIRQLQALPTRMYNVGCMMPWMDFEPRTLEEIMDGYQKYEARRENPCVNRGS